jgi:hypothetical protein
MTDKSPAKQQAVAATSAVARERRNFSPSECIELQEQNRLVNARKWEAAQIKANTALVPDGQAVAAQIEAIARLLENVKNQWVARKLMECGYDENELCTVNLSTGEVMLSKAQ